MKSTEIVRENQNLDQNGIAIHQITTTSVTATIDAAVWLIRGIELASPRELLWLHDLLADLQVQSFAENSGMPTNFISAALRMTDLVLDQLATAPIRGAQAYIEAKQH